MSSDFLAYAAQVNNDALRAQAFRLNRVYLYYSSKMTTLRDLYSRTGGSPSKQAAERAVRARMAREGGWGYRILDGNMNGFCSGYLLSLGGSVCLVCDTKQWTRVIEVSTGLLKNGEYSIYCDSLNKKVGDDVYAF